jgi:hypothetical protein
LITASLFITPHLQVQQIFLFGCSCISVTTNLGLVFAGINGRGFLFSLNALGKLAFFSDAFAKASKARVTV